MERKMWAKVSQFREEENVSFSRSHENFSLLA